MDKLIIGVIVIATFMSYYEPTPQQIIPSVSVAENRVEAPAQLPRSPALGLETARQVAPVEATNVQPYEAVAAEMVSEQAVKKFEKLNEELQLDCIHEGGHFYMSIHFNTPVIKASIEDSDTTGGFIRRYPTDVLETETLVHAAGYAAEMMFVHYSKTWGEFLKSADLKGRKIPKYADLADMLNNRPTEAKKAVIAAALILREHEPQVRKIAAALWKYKTLDAEQCRLLEAEIRAMEAQAQ
jgi:hypothetical protein